jgi:hypothetical protein
MAWLLIAEMFAFGDGGSPVLWWLQLLVSETGTSGFGASAAKQ